MKVLKVIKQNIKKSLPSVTLLRNSATQKPDGSYVTEGDMLVNQIIADTLRESLTDPFVIVSEENFNQNLSFDEIQSSDIFVIDPIDGTENFTSGLPEWGVSISRFKNGAHLESMLYCPEMDLYLDSNMRAIPRRPTVSRIAGISSSMRLEDLAKTTPGYEYRMFGCCVCSMIQTIRGCFLSFENPKRANSWDILAGLNLAQKAGLSVKVNGYDYFGEYLPHTEKYSFRIEQK